MKFLRLFPLLLLTNCIGRCTGNDIDVWQINYCNQVCKDHNGLDLIELHSMMPDSCLCLDGNRSDLLPTYIGK